MRAELAMVWSHSVKRRNFYRKSCFLSEVEVILSDTKGGEKKQLYFSLSGLNEEFHLNFMFPLRQGPNHSKQCFHDS